MENKIEELLKIKLELIGEEYGPALPVLDYCWQRAGRPTDAKTLIPVLKETLDTCTARGVRYPPIFLLRKGELTRGQFSPAVPRVISIKAPSHPKIPQEWCDKATEEWRSGKR